MANRELPGPVPRGPHVLHMLGDARQLASSPSRSRRNRAALGAGRSLYGAEGLGSWRGLGYRLVAQYAADRPTDAAPGKMLEV